MENEKENPASAGKKKKSGNFTQIPNEVILSQLTGNALKVYCYCKYRSGLKWWTIKAYDIQDRFGWSERQIQYLFAELKKCKLIETINNNQYILTEDKPFVNQEKKKRTRRTPQSIAGLQTEQKTNPAIDCTPTPAKYCGVPNNDSLSENDVKTGGINTVSNNTVTLGTSCICKIQNEEQIDEQVSQCSDSSIVNLSDEDERQEEIKTLCSQLWMDNNGKNALKNKLEGTEYQKKKKVYSFVEGMYTEYASSPDYEINREISKAHIRSIMKMESQFNEQQYWQMMRDSLQQKFTIKHN